MVTKSCMGDLNENGNFEEWNLITHGYNIRFSYMKGTILMIEFGLNFNRKMNGISINFRVVRVLGRC